MLNLRRSFNGYPAKEKVTSKPASGPVNESKPGSCRPRRLLEGDMRWGALGGICWVLLVVQVLAASPAELTGAVAYTEVMNYDYDQDGRIDKVQFWAEFHGRPATGKPDTPSYRPEAGEILFYLYDLERKKKILDWLQFSMAALPPNKPFPMTRILINGNRARFEANGVEYILVDGGKGYVHDRVTVNDGLRERQIRLYDGDIRISTGR
jgi:hypothetical protein